MEKNSSASLPSRRPVGIIVCSIFVILLGLGHVCLILLFIQKRSLFLRTLTLKDFLWLIPSAVYIISGVFVLSLKRWARVLMLLITGIYMVLLTIELGPFSISLIKTLIVQRNSNANFGIICLVLLFNIFLACALIGLVYYLTRASVRKQFK